MSLKAFHVVFIVIAFCLCVGFGVWGVRDAQLDGDSASLTMGICSFASAAVLGVYFVWFINKLRSVSFK